MSQATSIATLGYQALDGRSGRGLGAIGSVFSLIGAVSMLIGTRNRRRPYAIAVCSEILPWSVQRELTPASIACGIQLPFDSDANGPHRFRHSGISDWPRIHTPNHLRVHCAYLLRPRSTFGFPALDHRFLLLYLHLCYLFALVLS